MYVGASPGIRITILYIDRTSAVSSPVKSTTTLPLWLRHTSNIDSVASSHAAASGTDPAIPPAVV